MSANPMDQFTIKPLTKPFEVAGFDLTFTNSALWMAIAVGLSVVLMLIALRKRAVVPGRSQFVAESLYRVIYNMVLDNVGQEGLRYFPFVFTLFIFVLFGNVLGIIPGAFTFTSHLMVTFALAFFIFCMATLIALIRHGFKFFSFFFPEGAPLGGCCEDLPIFQLPSKGTR